MIMCFGLYEGGNRYRVEFVDFGPPPPVTGRGEQLLPAVERYAQILERYARSYPMNWFNFFPYWAHEESA